MKKELNVQWLTSSRLIPVKAVFGVGKARLLKRYLLKNEKAKAFLVSKAAAGKNRALREIIKDCSRSMNIKLIFAEVFPANTEWFKKTLIDLKSFSGDVDTVVGIGGGAIMDTAKLMSVLIGKSGGYRRIDKFDFDKKRKVSLILLPTTCGTGSELSKGLVLIDYLSGKRMGLKGNSLFADLAIIDPRLSLSCDKRCLQDSSFDALSHAVETYISRASTETTKKFSIFAIKAILDLEPKIKKGKLSAKEQEKLSFAGSLMGINLALSSTCLPHRISYALPRETQFGMTHARAVALFFRPWLRRLSENFPGAIQELDKDLGFSSIDAVGGFMKNIGLYISPERKIVNKDRNFSEYICGRLRGNLRNDPSYRSKKDIIDILNNS